MPSSQVPLALLVPFIAKADKVDDVVNFLHAGYDVQAEPDTIQWFAIQRTAHTPPTFRILDTFRGEDGRAADLCGKVLEALMANAATLLSESPEIASLNALANKVTVVEGSASKAAGLSVGLRVFLTANPDKVQAVQEFFLGALPIIEAEPTTTVWYALEFAGAIIDFFRDEEGRDAHLSGKAYEALFANADALLASPLDIAKFDVVAASVKV
ncbi:hypothetical protein DFH07DRAFT_973117 [Mycena maculata]|uniref:ABM domain-containing protein n=1 Tax=Mycena maculata TaxID=230809 RepID=A0AAD7HFV5_9AGAR|nr:hypothetical protein DFH07DRAFT_973117 [Mycena maculata]